MKIAIYGQSSDKVSEKIFSEILNIANDRNIFLIIEKKYNSIISKNHQHNHQLFASHYDLDNSIDLMITIGGDGTLLRSITYVRDLGIPIIGINSGRLGFLATLNQEMLNSELDIILNGGYEIRERTLLEVSFEKKSNALSHHCTVGDIA